MQSPVIFIMGVSGSGKTTIGKKLSEKTGIPFFDADDFHSLYNREKMKKGQPLTDEDRQAWLLSLNKLAKEHTVKKGAIIACSALKEKYRDLLDNGISADIHWVFLKGGYDLILERMKVRKNHYMPPGLLQSQFDILELPANAIEIDIREDADKITSKLMSALFPA
jgi:carbohydrate kinase (thermoresistant glucokinase family)